MKQTCLLTNQRVEQYMITWNSNTQRNILNIKYLKVLLLFLINIVFLESYTANSQELVENSPDNFYTIDFVFTGKVKPGLDSIFVLRYKFTKLSLSKFDKLLLEDSSRKRVLNLSKLQSNDTTEVQSDGTYTYLIIKKYDIGDLPVLIQGVDKKGISQDLYISSNDGSFKNAIQFKEMEKKNNERIRQSKAGRK